MKSGQILCVVIYRYLQQLFKTVSMGEKMKKALSILTIILLSFSTFSFAEDTSSTDTTDGMQKCPMMGMGMMMPRVVANLQDGSILVISGHQLYKYDQNLKLVQQTTIPIDTTIMQSMQRMCPGPKQGSPRR